MPDSSFEELKDYLIQEGFGLYESEQDNEENYFYFIWDSNKVSNYRIGVTGNYDKDLNVTNINII